MEAVVIKRVLLLFAFIASFVSSAAQEGVIGEIVVRGLQNVSEVAVTVTMRTKVGQAYMQSRLTSDKKTLESLGLFQSVNIYGVLLDDGKWRVVVDVVEWPLVLGFQIEGNTVITDEEIVEAVEGAGISIGSVFNYNSYDPAADAIHTLYRNLGLFAKIDKFEPAPNDGNLVLIEIVEARISKIEISGLTRTKPSVIRRLMDTKEGSLFHEFTWRDDLTRIVNTRWFDKIEPDTREDPDQLGGLILLLYLEDGQTGLFNIGVQTDARNNLAGLLSVAETNLFGTGKSVGINFMQSAQGLGTSFKLDYGDPFMDARRTAFNVSVFSRSTLIFGGGLFGSGGFSGDTRFAQRRTGMMASVTRELSRDMRGTVGLRGERVNTKDFIPDPGEEFVLQDGDIMSLNMGITRNTRDNNIDPSRGDWLRVALEPSFANITSVGGFTSGFDILGANFFSRATLDYRKYFSAGPPRKPEEFDSPRRIIAARLFAGTAVGRLPFFEQFFVGGANGVRGYSEDRFWGHNALLAQLEYRHPIQKAFNVVAFIDYGGAWGGDGSVAGFTQSSSFDLHLGYGVGINFRTAFGPIRLDIGIDEHGRSRTHFQIGTSF